MSENTKLTEIAEADIAKTDPGPQDDQEDKTPGDQDQKDPEPVDGKEKELTREEREKKKEEE